MLNTADCANATPTVKAAALLAQIRADVEAKRLKPIDLAREAGLQPSTLYSMLEPDWTNRAVANLEALAEAYARITTPNSPAATSAPA